MSVMSALALYGILWFLTMFIILPIRMKTQGEAGDVVPGTHSSAPSEVHMWAKAKLVTLVSAVLFAIVAAIIYSEVITFDMIERITRGQ